MVNKIKKQKMEFYCPKCKKTVDIADTFGETGVCSPIILAGQAWPKTSRYHKKCESQLIELMRKK